MNISQEDLGVTGAARLGSAVSQQEWEIVEYGDGDSLVIHYAGTDDRVCFMATPGERGSAERILANAHLIAAAPDLLEALKEAKAVLRGHDPEQPYMRSIRTAIAKAEGRSALSTSVRKDAVPNTPVNSQSTEKE